MTNVLAIAFLLLAGPGFLAMGAVSLRRGYWRDSVPLLEVVIGRAIGAGPLPRTRWDRRFAFGQAFMLIVFGSFFSLCLAAVLILLVVPE